MTCARRARLGRWPSKKRVTTTPRNCCCTSRGWKSSCSSWERSEDSPRVTAHDIAEVVSMWTGVPVMQIAEEESQRLLQMESALHARVVGQDEAIDALSKAVRRARAGLQDTQRPGRSVIFLCL